MQLQVRRIAAHDRERWAELFAAYVAFYETAVAEAVIEQTWQRLLAAGEGDPIGFVAVAGDDRPVGLAHLLFHRSTWSPTWYCYLEDLFVDPACRGMGAGRALIAAVYREADARGATRTYWVTQSHNAMARTLYNRVAQLVPFVQYRR